MVSVRRNNSEASVELAKGFTQKKFTLEVPDKSGGDIKAFREKIDQAKNMVLQTMILSSKYQILGDDKGNKSNDMLNAIATIAKFDMDEMQLIQSIKTADIQQKAAFAQNTQLEGKRASIDDSVRNFSGGSVNFRYQILGKDLPTGAAIQTQISVMTPDGRKVFSETKNTGKLGKNTFLWDGKDNAGNILEKGDYSITVSATYTLPGKNTSPALLTTSTTKEGIIERIEIEDTEISFVIDGTKYSADSIKGITRGGTENIDEKQKPISDYISYVGKTVTIEQNTINFRGKPTQVPLTSKQNIKDATVKIEFMDESGQFVAYAQSKQDIHNGQNHFLWNGWDAKSSDEFKEMTDKKLDISYLPTGIYKYKVTVISTDKNGNEIETTLDNKGSFLIDSVYTSSGKTVLGSENYKFDIKDVIKISESTPNKDSFAQMLDTGANLVGKGYATYINDQIDYDGTNKPAFFFSIPSLNNTTINEARIKIIDQDNQTVATITKAATDLYYEDAEPAPQLKDTKNIKDVLSQGSILKLREFWSNTFPDQPDDSKATPQQKQQVQQWINYGFRNGTITQKAYDALPDDDAKQAMLLKNTGLIPVTWDGNTTSGGKAKAGTYKYTIEYDVTDNATGVSTTHKASRDTSGGVVFTRISDNGELILGLEGDVEIPISRMTKYSAIRT